MKKISYLGLILFLLTSCVEKQVILERQSKSWVSPTQVNINANQSTLSSIALHDPDRDVRIMAVEKLTNQSALSSVAMHDKDNEVRKVALKHLK